MLKTVEENFLIDPSIHYKKLQNALYVIAFFVVISNLFVSIALGIKTILILLVAMLATRETEMFFFYQTKNAAREKSLLNYREHYGHLDGLLIGLLMPIGISLFSLVIVCFFVNFFVKNSFGGFSYNVFSIALVARVFAEISFGINHVLGMNFTDNVLVSLFGEPSTSIASIPYSVGLFNFDGNYLLASNTDYMLGSIPAIFIIILGLYLIKNKVIDYIIPISIIGFMIIFSFILNEYSYTSDVYILNSIFLGPFLFLTFFLATDPIIVPNSKVSKVIYSLLIVLVILVIRETGSNYDGVVYAILFANMLVPMFRAKNNMYKGIKKIIIIVIIFALSIAGTILVANNHKKQTKEEYKTQEIYKLEGRGIYE